jgi:hypothetical protein
MSTQVICRKIIRRSAIDGEETGCYRIHEYHLFSADLKPLRKANFAVHDVLSSATIGFRKRLAKKGSRRRVDGVGKPNALLPTHVFTQGTRIGRWNGLGPRCSSRSSRSITSEFRIRASQFPISVHGVSGLGNKVSLSTASFAYCEMLRLLTFYLDALLGGFPQRIPECGLRTDH